MSENYLLGMDLGTTNIKAILMGDDGTVIASASRQNRLITPGPNMVEQNADEWWSNAADVFREIKEKVGAEIIRNVRGVSISSQTVTMLPVDSDGRPLRNALIWLDKRSAGEMHRLTRMIGHENYVSIVGAQPDAAFLPNKILWFKEREPELFARTKAILQANSYINLKLTGEFTMDMDQATRCQCLDMNTMKWSKVIGDAIGVNLDDYLPVPQQPIEIIGEVTEAAARVTGLAKGTPVVAGACDALTSMYATGISRLGEASESSGTSSLVFVGSTVASPAGAPVSTRPCAIEGMPYVFDAPMNSAGSTIKWYIDTFGDKDKEIASQSGKNVYTYINEVAETVSPGSGGLLFLPYLMGERAPLWNSHAKGVFIGMSINTTHEDIMRSVFEGTAFALRHVITTIKEFGGKAELLRITGGGAKSRTWSKIKASMLHMPVFLLDDKSGEVPFGDVLLAGQATGVFPNLTEAIDRMVTVTEVIEPDKEWEKVYDSLYPYYVEMYQCLDKELIKYKETWEWINGTILHKE